MITKGKLKGVKVVVFAEEGKQVLQVHGHTGTAILDSLVQAFGPMADEPAAAPKRRGRKPKAKSAEAPVAAEAK